MWGLSRLKMIEERMKEIHKELLELQKESVELFESISMHLKGLKK